MRSIKQESLEKSVSYELGGSARNGIVVLYNTISYRGRGRLVGIGDFNGRAILKLGGTRHSEGSAFTANK